MAAYERAQALRPDWQEPRDELAGLRALGWRNPAEQRAAANEPIVVDSSDLAAGGVRSQLKLASLYGRMGTGEFAQAVSGDASP